MSNTIADELIRAWTSGRKTKKNSKGWVSGNAVCCPHNGETIDKRGRGGVIVNHDGTASYACFNCNFKVTYVPGNQLSYKFKKLLQWLNVDEGTIGQLSITALRERQRQQLLGIIKKEVVKEELKVKFKIEELPEEAHSFLQIVAWHDLKGSITYPDGVIRAVEYVDKRKIDMQKYDFYWTPSVAEKMDKRVIIPFTWKDMVIGYSARTFVDGVTPKYITHVDSGYVFNFDKQAADWEFVIVCEGIFDALSIDGVAILKSDATTQQVALIESLEREVIAVPDWNKSGMHLLDLALERGWSVSFPVWAETCEDVNEAVQKYGRLFVMKSILDAKETSALKINLLRRTYGIKK